MKKSYALTPADRYLDAIGFLRELEAAGFDVSATGTRLVVAPAYCLSREDRWGIARHGAALAKLITATETEGARAH